MTYNPLDEVIDEELDITTEALDALRNFRAEEKLALLPGVDTSKERNQLTQKLNDLIDKLLRGLKDHPSKLWVMTQFQAVLLEVEQFDTEAREHFGMELEQIMDILEIESSDGLLSYYLGGL